MLGKASWRFNGCLGREDYFLPCVLRSRGACFVVGIIKTLKPKPDTGRVFNILRMQFMSLSGIGTNRASSVLCVSLEKKNTIHVIVKKAKM